MRLPSRPTACPIDRLRIDARFAAWAILASLVALVVFGLTSAIIPNPVFGRSIAPEPFAIAVWILSAPLMGLIAATYLAPAAAEARPLEMRQLAAGPGGDVTAGGVPGGQLVADGGAADGGRTLLGYAGGLAAFLAIGCPVCNKIALVLLGTSGALTVWAPLQPLIGAASLVLLAGTLAWRLRLRARGGGCAVA